MPKAVKKPKSPSPVDSAEDQIEMCVVPFFFFFFFSIVEIFNLCNSIDTPSKPPTRNSKPGIPASRHVYIYTNL